MQVNKRFGDQSCLIHLCAESRINYIVMTPLNTKEEFEAVIGKARQHIETCSEACNTKLSKIEEDLKRSQEMLRQVEASMSGIVNDSQQAIPNLFEAVAKTMARSLSDPLKYHAQGEARVDESLLDDAQAVVVMEASEPHPSGEDIEHAVSRRTPAPTQDSLNDVPEETSERGVATRTRRRKGVGTRAAKQ